jgi:hypothetical protein
VLIELKLLPAVFSPNFKSDADFFLEREMGKNRVQAV